MKSYIRDDIPFLNSIPQKKEQTRKQADPVTLIVAFDATNLDSNVSHNLGKQSILFWIGINPGAFNQWFNQMYFTDSKELILNNKPFHFQKKSYFPNLGTLIGTKMALMNVIQGL